LYDRKQGVSSAAEAVHFWRRAIMAEALDRQNRSAPPESSHSSTVSVDIFVHNTGRCAPDPRRFWVTVLLPTFRSAV
jgi:hypothetical protein